MNRRPYHVRGELLATHDQRCYTRGLDLADVDHDRLAVDLVVQARDTAAAASEAAWIAAQGYATWRWHTGPVVAAAAEGVEV